MRFSRFKINSGNRLKLEESFEKRIRFRIQEERKVVELEYNDVILAIENKQKQEIEKLTEKLHASNEASVSFLFRPKYCLDKRKIICI